MENQRVIGDSRLKKAGNARAPAGRTKAPYPCARHHHGHGGAGLGGGAGGLEEGGDVVRGILVHFEEPVDGAA